jgi:hypothetical protein
MVGPVLQGYANQEETKFIVTCASPTYAHGSLSSLPSLEDDPESGSETIEISESFLAGSLWPLMQTSPLPDDLPLTNGHASVNGMSDDVPVMPSYLSFRIDTLREPISTGDECSLYLCAADLGRIGALSGDWVSVVYFYVHAD